MADGFQDILRCFELCEIQIAIKLVLTLASGRGENLQVAIVVVVGEVEVGENTGVCFFDFVPPRLVC